MTRLFSRLRDRERASERNGWNGNGHAHRATPHTVARTRHVVTAAESAPCTCPDFCERDHQTD